MSTDSSSNEEDSQESTEGILKTGEKSKIGLAITTILFFSSIVFLIVSVLIPEVPRMFGFSLLALTVISGLITTFMIAVDKFIEAAGL